LKNHCKEVRGKGLSVLGKYERKRCVARERWSYKSGGRRSIGGHGGEGARGKFGGKKTTDEG